LLEAAIRGRGPDLARLARSITRAREDQVDDEDAHVQKLLDCVRSVQGSEIWKRAINALQVLPEVPLMMRAGGGGELPGTTPLFLRGVIDLAFREENGWVIVDYKTDQLKDKPLASLVEHYRPQVQCYADAWVKLLREPVHEIGLYFTRANHYEPLKGPGA
jgi:ATP-dependent helicase/nuclease subunit A